MIASPRCGRRATPSGTPLALVALATIVLLAFLVAPAAAQDPYAEAAKFRWGKSNAALGAIETQLRSARGDALRAAERNLLALLESPAATVDSKSWACRMLRMFGSAQAVPVLAGLLSDSDLSADAQFALRSIPGAEVDKALRDAVGRTRRLQRAGVVQTLGARRDVQALSLIAPLASDDDPLVAEAALYALGQIGNVSGEAARHALSAIASVKPTAGAGAQPPTIPANALVRSRRHAMLLCAESLCRDGAKAEAAAVYRGLYAEPADDALRSAALAGVVAAQQEQAIDLLQDAMKSHRAALRATAATLLCEKADVALAAAALRNFAAWPADAQALVLGGIKRPGALGVVRGALSSKTPAVRIAAVAALGRLGDAPSAAVLTLAATEGGAVQAAARKSLQQLRGPGVDDALLALAASTKADPAAVRAEAIAALAVREAVSAVPALVALASDAEPAVRAEAVRSLARLAEPRDVPALVAVLVKEQGERQRAAMESALVALARRAEDKESVAGPLAAALAGAPPAARSGLLRALSQAPCGKSLAALRAALTDGDAAVYEAAVRGLAAWPDGAVLPDLLTIAKAAERASIRQAALRGILRLAKPAAGQPPSRESAQHLIDALAVSRTTEEKAETLAALGESGHADALAPALACVADAALELDAAKAVVRLARRLHAAQPDAAANAIERLRGAVRSPEAKQVAESSGVMLRGMVNVAPTGTATSPDGHESDGQASGDQAAIDGNPDTYWDEADGQALYRLVVSFPKAEKIAALSIMGYAQHNFAPKDFEVLCDGKVVKKVVGAEYVDNLFISEIPETTCRTVELKITGYYGASPAIRELGLYRRVK